MLIWTEQTGICLDQVARHGRHADGAILEYVRSPGALTAKDKLYALAFEALVADHSSAHLGVSGSLPVVLREGEEYRLILRITDGLTFESLERIKAMRLNLLFVHLTPVERYRLEMNRTVQARANACARRSCSAECRVHGRCLFVDLVSAEKGSKQFCLVA